MIKKSGLDKDYYAPSEKRAGATGRVLVEFGIDASGSPTSVRVTQANADRGLQAGALDLVSHLRFDVTSPAYNSADPTPHGVLVTFCLQRCAAYPAYPAEEIIAIGSIMGHPYPKAP